MSFAADLPVDHLDKLIHIIHHQEEQVPDHNTPMSNVLFSLMLLHKNQESKYFRRRIMGIQELQNNPMINDTVKEPQELLQEYDQSTVIL